VPKGETLIIDQSTNNLHSIIVEGILLFSDDKDMTVDARFIIIRAGKLIIGTEQEPY